MPTTYALLVGIDAYPHPVPPLRGCVADAEAMRTVLAERVPDAQVRMLTDGQATRAAVLAEFASHLGQAKAGDVAVFWYAGHGSQQPTASAPGVEPDGLDETLVLVDSRTAAGSDLADKELAGLIAAVARAGVHVFVGLDCCHSGSGTREILPEDVRVRRAPADRRIRSADSYAGTAAPGRHVLLAACRSDQTAKEVPMAGTPRGALTAAVEQALRGAGAAQTYRDLHRAVRAAIERDGVDQVPQLEVTNDADALLAIWSGALRDRPPHYLLSYDGARWLLDAGAVHGIPPVSGSDPTLLDVFPSDAANLTDRSSAVAAAEVIDVQPARSTVLVTGELDPSRTYRAVVTSWPLPKVPVAVEAGLEDVRTALLGSLVVVEGEQADLSVRAAGEAVEIVDATLGGEPVARIAAGRAAYVVASLEQIARWRQSAALDNPASSISPATVVMEVHSAEDGRLLSGDEVVLRYGAAGPQAFTVAVRNTGTSTLRCALLGLDESYGVATLLGGNAEWLAPGEVATTQVIRATVPDDLWHAGVTRRTDIVKLIVSGADFDPGVLTQGGLPRPVLPAMNRETRDAAPGNTLARLLRRVQQRELVVGAAPDAGADWATATVRIVSERLQPGVPVGTDVSLAPGVTLDAPPGLSGVASLTSAEVVSRDLTAPLVPPMLQDDPAPWAALSLVPLRGAAPQLDVLELRDVSGIEAVTPSQPLVLRLATSLPADESALVIGYDGENYLVVGRLVRDGFDGTTVLIEHLPPAADTRSLTGSVRLLFRRFLHQAVGQAGFVTRLAVATLDPGGAVRYDDDAGRLRAAVSTAERILLLIHGILGDTEGMVRGAGAFGGGYDLVLAFDYENINTPVRGTSVELKRKLAAAGLGGTKRVDIVAHSMGGLVARWLIEQDEASGLVARLITAGTPNGGSPWPVIQDWAMLALTFGLNQLANVFWPARIVSGLVRLVEKADAALDDMAPGSGPLKVLYSSADPGLPYTVLVGNRALIVDVVPNGRVASILHSLKRSSFDAALGMAFLGAPNDLAVAVSSATQLPAGREPAPDVQLVACDHITFFSSEAGLAALSQAVVAG